MAQTIDQLSAGTSPVDGLADDTAEYLAPDYAKGRLYDSGPDQWLWLIASILLAVVAFKVVGLLPLKLIGMAICLLAGVAGFITTNEGQGYLLPGDHLRSRRIRKSQGFISPDMENAIQPDQEYGVGLVSLYVGEERETEFGRLPTGFMVPTHGKRIAFVFALGGSRFAGANWRNRKRFEQAFVDVLGQAASMVGFDAAGVAYAWINGTRPASPHPLVHKLRSYALHPDFLSPAPGTPEAVVATALDQRIRAMYYNGAEVVNYFVVTVNTPPAWQKALADGSDLELTAIEDSTIQLMIHHLLGGMGAVGYRNASCLNALELDEFVLTQRSIADVGVVHAKLFARRLRFLTMSTDEILDELARSNPWPDNLIRLVANYIYMDGTYIRMFRTLNYGLWRRFRPGSMLSVQCPKSSRWNVTTVIGRVIGAVDEEKRMTRAIVFRKALSDKKAESQRYLSKREQDDRVATEREQTEMYRQHAPVYKFDRLVAVRTPSKRLMGLYTIATLGAHVLKMIALGAIKLEVRQVRAFIRAVLGADF